MKTCILMPTYDRYRPLALFTAEMIGRFWASHPPVFMCGCSTRAGGNDLPLCNDPKDWVGILRAAAESLLGEGYGRTYLIIDDCPPVDECSWEHLNITLPGLMDRLNACNISLTGWDQRGGKGEILGKEFFRMQRCRQDFPWRFSAGPSLWNLEALRDLLDLLVPSEDPLSRSAWAFERRLGDGSVVIPEKWTKGSYRICGLELLGGQRGRFGKARSLVRRRIKDFTRLGIRVLAGERMLAKYDRAGFVESAFYDGPYPAYWAGIMTAGTQNQNMTQFLERHGKYEFLKKMTEAVGRILQVS